MKLWLVPRLAALVIRTLRLTMRIRCEGRDHLDTIRREGGRYIHAFWHGQLLMMPYSYPGGKMAVMISEHRDGEYIARTMRSFGHRSVRGSTTSGGTGALRQAARLAGEGYDLGFTPDGPRGPRHRVQAGVVMAGRLTGLPIVPVAFAARPARTMSSWDRFLVPVPFARGVVVYGPPVRVPVGAGREELEEIRGRLEESLARCTRRAAQLVSDPGGFRALAPLPGMAR